MWTISNNLFFDCVIEQLQAGRQVRIRLRGDSMFPMLRNGKDTVIIAPCHTNELKTMDVVLFRYKGNYVLHRIIHRNDDRLTIRGDGTFASIEECMTTDVVGKLVAIVRPSGKEISTDNWKWKIPSRLWNMTGVFRPILLRIAYRMPHFFSINRK